MNTLTPEEKEFTESYVYKLAEQKSSDARAALERQGFNKKKNEIDDRLRELYQDSLEYYTKMAEKNPEIFSSSVELYTNKLKNLQP